MTPSAEPPQYPHSQRGGGFAAVMSRARRPALAINPATEAGKTPPGGNSKVAARDNAPRRNADNALMHNNDGKLT